MAAVEKTNPAQAKAKHAATPWTDPKAEPYIRIENVTKKFGEFVAVSNVSLNIYRGELFSLLGGSGCGKTTLLRMLAGFETPTSGKIYIDGVDMAGIPPYDRPTNMMFQSYALFPHMTVEQNVAFGLKQDKYPDTEIQQRVAQMLDLVQLTPFAKRKPHQLSGGQRQRVAVGRAIVREPQVFLMDEPLSNLDAKLRVEARSFISKLHQRLNTTFIYVTHDQTEAMTMGTRIAVLNAGELQQVDSPFNLYHNPRNLFVAGFIGSPSMNFFDTTLKMVDGKMVAETAGFQLTVPANRVDAFRDHAGKRVIMGIRPEDIHDAEFQPPGIIPGLVEANVDVVEQMGNEMILYLEDHGKTFIARTDPRTQARVGKRMGVAMNMDNVHIFDVDNQHSLAFDYKTTQFSQKATV